jgi:hypothetical protein
MKLNPYPVLLTTAALMVATVVLAQTDVSSFAARAWSSLHSRVLVADEPPGSDVAKHPDTRLASSVETARAAGGDDHALEE